MMDLELRNLINEVLRKIGRNVILFQHLEALLKFLLKHGPVSGTAKDLPEIIVRRDTSIHKRTMGQLVGGLFKTIVSESETIYEEPEDTKELWFSLEFKIKDGDGFPKLQETLTTIVTERNELVHHFLARWDMNSFENLKAAEQYLDQQRDKVLSDVGALQELVDTIKDMKKHLAALLTNPDFPKQFEQLWLRQSQIVILLAQIAQQKARPDGWTELTTAGKLIRQHVPEEAAALKQRYGHKTLKRLMVATDVFDIREEPTARGGVRVLYRMKPECTLEVT